QIPKNKNNNQIPTNDLNPIKKILSPINENLLPDVDKSHITQLNLLNKVELKENPWNNEPDNIVEGKGMYVNNNARIQTNNNKSKTINELIKLINDNDVILKKELTKHEVKDKVTEMAKNCKPNNNKKQVKTQRANGRYSDFKDNYKIKEFCKYEVEKTFKSTLKIVQTTEYNKRQQIFKIPSIKLRTDIINLINEVISEMDLQTNINLKEIIDITYAASLTYQQLNNNGRKTSHAYEKKIENIKNLERIKNILSKFIGKNEKITNNEKEILKKHITKFEMKDPKKMLETTKQQIEILKISLEKFKKRNETRKINYIFELNRSYFYRKINGEKEYRIGEYDREKIKAYWKNVWNGSYNKDTENNMNNEKPINTNENNIDLINENFIISYEEFCLIIKKLPSWKAPGVDGVYNFWIKTIVPLHKPLYIQIIDIINNKSEQDELFYTAKTHLIPKKENPNESELRPISCLSVYYKLTTKIVTKHIQSIIENNETLETNQLGCMKYTRGAAEQFMFNRAITQNNKKLKVCYIDIRKAYDSVNHDKLISTINKLRINENVKEFITNMVKRQKILLTINHETISEIYPQRGILQGDSLSPLLFIIYINEFSKKLNESNYKINISNTDSQETYQINHLTFIDDIKIFAKDEKILEKLVEQSKIILKDLGFDINYSKTKASLNINEIEAINDEGYMYLGVKENKKNNVDKSNYIMLRNKILNRNKTLTNINLYAKNHTRAHNEFVYSTINYYTGILDFSPTFLREIDKEIRLNLSQTGIHNKNNSIERLYIKRKDAGRGYLSFATNYFNNILRLYYYVKKCDTVRKKIIYKFLIDNNKYLSNIINEYQMDDINGDKNIDDVIKRKYELILTEQKNKAMHGIYYNNLDLEYVDKKMSIKFIKNANYTKTEENIVFNLQDRNNYWLRKQYCKYCKQMKSTYDHLATQCRVITQTKYLQRHNKVVLSIYNNLIKHYNLKKQKIKTNYEIPKVTLNGKIKILSDYEIKTSYKIKYNKPDLVVIDENKQTIMIIDVGITNAERIKIYELEKINKYFELAKDLTRTYKMKTITIPFIISWDGIISKRNKQHRSLLHINDNLMGFIQLNVLKSTYNIIKCDMEYAAIWGDEPNDISIKEIESKYENDKETIKTKKEIEGNNPKKVRISMGEMRDEDVGENGGDVKNKEI
ncbi:MAG: reverse transcriptase family protein, partial [Bacilli bacterium]